MSKHDRAAKKDTQEFISMTDRSRLTARGVSGTVS